MKQANLVVDGKPFENMKTKCQKMSEKTAKFLKINFYIQILFILYLLLAE
jgi:hypothetical protein